MSMKEKVKSKLKSAAKEEVILTEDSSYRHAIDIVLDNGKYYLMIVKYNPETGASAPVNKIDLGSVKATALHKAGFVLGDKVLRGLDIKPEFLRG